MRKGFLASIVLVAVAVVPATAVGRTHKVHKAQARPHQVYICHGTGSNTNPYTTVYVDTHAANLGGHGKHIAEGRDYYAFNGNPNDPRNIDHSQAGQDAADAACGNAPPPVPGPGPKIAVTKVAAPLTKPAPGGTFTFTVQVSNPSTTTPLKITSLGDNIYGPECAALVGTTLAPGATSAPCTFTGTFTGVCGASQTDTVTAMGTDGATTVSASAMARVNLTCAPPPVGCPPGTFGTPPNCVRPPVTVVTVPGPVAPVPVPAPATPPVPGPPGPPAPAGAPKAPAAAPHAAAPRKKKRAPSRRAHRHVGVTG